MNSQAAYASEPMKCPAPHHCAILGVMGYQRRPATAFAMDKAQSLAPLRKDTGLQREIASLSLWDCVRPR